MKPSIVLFAILHIISPVLVKLTDELHEVGSSKLMDYKWGDFVILAVTCAALAATNAISFFSTKWADYKVKKEGTAPPFVR
jgi:hypothetical protein